MKSIGRFLKNLFVTTPYDLVVAAVLVVVCMVIMVGPFFGFDWSKDTSDKESGRGSAVS